MRNRYLAYVTLLFLLGGCSQFTPNTKITALPPAENRAIEIAPKHSVDPKGQSVDKTADKTAIKDLLSVANVRLLADTIELSQLEMSAGKVQFNVLNETAEPLTLQIIKTDIAPDKIKITAGQVDRGQPGVEVSSQVAKHPVKPGMTDTLIETLTPGEYKVVVTSTSRAEPIAYTVLTLLHTV